MGCFLVNYAFFVYCVKKRIVDHAPRRYIYAKNASAIVVTTSEISNQFMCSFLQVSCSSHESAVKQERSNCIVSFFRLSVRFD